ncbi:conserved hypothetical protein [Teredinibacter turnerae T7901]|uniref:Uncharacterized protein n=1 Tax=Teredinibacter turnerae (strain ATCC 39867 / T7901) TaxID=377629 RepID=C5BJ77_TERTT|nr:conserved hypothetical protein [Teredinibacter turnerae T7901]
MLYNALLSCTYCGERFCVKLSASEIHKNERSSMCLLEQFVMSFCLYCHACPCNYANYPLRTSLYP